MKQCPQCGSQKPTTDYYKNKSNKDGLQRCCKECCNINSRKFRTRNPNYYWGDNGYFTQRYEETMEYTKEMCRANKSSKIYKITTPDGIYIGSTKRKLNLRLNTHLADYRNRFLKRGINNIPLLYNSFSNYTIDEVRGFLRSAELIEEFDGTILKTKEREDFWMQYYRGTGCKMLNTYRAIGRTYKKKMKEILENEK
jgi:hypothetical protein